MSILHYESDTHNRAWSPGMPDTHLIRTFAETDQPSARPVANTYGPVEAFLLAMWERPAALE